MKGACHPAFLSLPRMVPFDFSARARLRATRLIMARFSGPFSFRFRARSSFMVTSSTQCRLCSMAQWPNERGSQQGNARRRAGYMKRQTFSILINGGYHLIAFILYQLNFFQSTLHLIVMLFGFGIVFDIIATILLFYLESNPCSGLNVANPVRKRDKRKPFSIDHVSFPVRSI